MDPGETLRNYRVEAGMSQAELARLVGVTEGAVGLWERGVSVPKRARAEEADQVLEARGDVLEAFGYAAKRPRYATQAEVAHLRDLVAVQGQQLLELTKRAERVEKALVDLVQAGATHAPSL